MRDHYDFSKGRRNPHVKLAKRPITIRLAQSTLDHFQRLAEELELPYQSLINLYLRECAEQGGRLSLTWTGSKKATIPARSVREHPDPAALRTRTRKKKP